MSDTPISPTTNSSYEAERQAVESRLNAIFSTRDVNNFVDLTEIHALVAPHDKRPTERLLHGGKVSQCTHRLIAEGIEPVFISTQTVSVHQDVALEVVRAKRADLKEFVRRWEGDISLVIGSTPEILSRIKDVFGDANRIRHVKLDGKFYFAAVDLAKIALWEGESTPSVNAISVYIQRAAEKDPSLAMNLQTKHNFGPGQPSSILDITDAARLWMLLPGRRATVFRSEVIKTWVRVFGGDLTLVDEIIRNHAVQKSLPDDSPMRAFADAANESSGMHIQSQLVSLSTQVGNLAEVVRDLERSQLEKTRDLFEGLRRNLQGDVFGLLSNGDRSRSNNFDGLRYCFAHLKNQLEMNATGETDPDFRVEIKSFIAALADEFFWKMGRKTPPEAAAFVLDAFNTKVDLSCTRRRIGWSSLSVTALFQKCILSRVRYWRCVERNNRYPNAKVAKEILHSTYMNVKDFLTTLQCICIGLGEGDVVTYTNVSEMMDGIMTMFPDVDCHPALGEEIPVAYYTRVGTAVSNIQVPDGQSTLDGFVAAIAGQTHKRQEDESDDDDEPMVLRPTRRRIV